MVTVGLLLHCDPWDFSLFWLPQVQTVVGIRYLSRSIIYQINAGIHMPRSSISRALSNKCLSEVMSGLA
jgi:hypothetical protein